LEVLLATLKKMADIHNIDLSSLAVSFQQPAHGHRLGGAQGQDGLTD